MEADRTTQETCFDALARTMQERGITHCIINVDSTLLAVEDEAVRAFAQQRLHALRTEQSVGMAYVTAAPRGSIDVKPRFPLHGEDAQAVARAIGTAYLFLDNGARADRFMYVSGENAPTDTLRQVSPRQPNDVMAHFCLTAGMLQDDYDRTLRDHRAALVDWALPSEDLNGVQYAPQEVRSV